MFSLRVGNGFDVHRFEEDRELILGGVTIPHTHGLMGHSDADVLTHSLMDALLGACSLGDIGMHFPDTDSQWKDASSLDLLDLVLVMINRQGFAVENVDATVICQAPRIAPHIQQMRKNLARHLGGIDLSRVSIKATTSEGLGFTGRGEGIAVQSTVLLSSIEP
jgi:2-C-methyl-D-erythritol 2,4-cyclodiphosphate synthase